MEVEEGNGKKGMKKDRKKGFDVLQTGMRVVIIILLFIFFRLPPTLGWEP